MDENPGDWPRRLRQSVRWPAGDCAAIAERGTSKFAFVELHRQAGKMAAAAFLRNLIAAVPYKLHIVLTEPSLVRHWFNPNGGGIRFADHERHIHAFEHIFGRICREHQIDHRPTKIRPPWSHEDKKTIRGIVFPNGQIERIPLTVCRQTVAGQRNLTIKDATVKRFHYNNHDQLRNHLAKFAYRGPAVQQRL